MLKKIIFIIVFVLYLPLFFKQLALLENILDEQQQLAENFKATAQTLKQVKIKVKKFNKMERKIEEANQHITNLINQASTSNVYLKQSIPLQEQTYQRLANLDVEIIKLNHNLSKAKSKLQKGVIATKQSEKNFDKSGKKLLTIKSTLNKTAKIVGEINKKLPAGK